MASEVTGAPWIRYLVSDSYKCIEQDRPLYMVFVDFSKAFDTVGRTGLWQLLRKYECPEKFTMIEALHTGMMANVSIGGEVSESFSVTNGVKQGCVLAHTLFSIFLLALIYTVASLIRVTSCPLVLLPFLIDNFLLLLFYTFNISCQSPAEGKDWLAPYKYRYADV